MKKMTLVAGALGLGLIFGACGSTKPSISGDDSALTSLTQNKSNGTLVFTWVPSYNYNYAVQSNGAMVTTNYEKIVFIKKGLADSGYKDFSGIGDSLLNIGANGSTVSFAKGKTITETCTRTSFTATEIKYSCINSSQSKMSPTNISVDPSGDCLIKYNLLSFIVPKGAQPIFSKDYFISLWGLSGFDTKTGLWKTLTLFTPNY